MKKPFKTAHKFSRYKGIIFKKKKQFQRSVVRVLWGVVRALGWKSWKGGGRYTKYVWNRDKYDM